MNTAFTVYTKNKCLLQNPYHSKCTSVVHVVNMTWQVHSIVIQDEIPIVILFVDIVSHTTVWMLSVNIEGNSSTAICNMHPFSVAFSYPRVMYYDTMTY